VPFARYVARCGVTHLKRYSVDNVYRESRLVGLHPRELAACSFDVVTTPGGGQSLVADAEVIAVVSEIVHEVCFQPTALRLSVKVKVKVR